MKITNKRGIFLTFFHNETEDKKIADKFIDNIKYLILRFVSRMKVFTLNSILGKKVCDMFNAKEIHDVT